MLSLPELKNILEDPKETVKGLDKYVIGQTAAKKMLAMLQFNRSLLMLQRNRMISNETPITKSNALMIGSTGSGKTALIRALSKVIGIPITIYDITGTTSSGYIGNDVEDMLNTHIDNIANYVQDRHEELKAVFIDESGYPWTKEAMIVELSEIGLIYIDEFDKIKQGEKHNDVVGKLVQQELLKFLENGIVNLVKDRRRSNVVGIKELDTKDIFFVCGGAFSDIEDIVEQRISKDGGIGFSAKLTKGKDAKELTLQNVTNEDLVAYGFMPEILGRLPLRASLNKLSLSDMIRVIKEPEGALLKEAEFIFKLFEIDFKISPAGFKEMAQKAIDMGIGARALRSMINKIVNPYLENIYNFTEKKIIVSKQDVIKLLGD